MEESQINRRKRFQRNCYFFSDKIFRLIWWLALALMVASMVQPLLLEYSTVMHIVLDILIALTTWTIGMLLSKPTDAGIYSYKRENGFLFLGLHDLSEENLLENAQDIISRETEADYLTHLLEEVIFPQGNIKQAICLTGKSGCGKSTILAFFEQIHRNDEYEIYNFSGNYQILRSTLEERFNTQNIVEKLHELTGNQKKVVFIFDQFERYFFLSQDKQTNIREFIISLCQYNTGILISLREEYLADFLREFDLNDIKTNCAPNSEVEHHGLMRDLVGYVRESEHYIVLQGINRNITYTRCGHEHIKNPCNYHIIDPVTNGVAEYNRTGVTLFYCENQNNASDSRLSEKCESCFPEAAHALFPLYKSKPLIEQQIVFHMAESDKKLRGTDSATVFCTLDEQEIMKRYFDHQLTATGDYFNASRVMYALSQARIHQVSMKTHEIEIGLFADHFSVEGTKRLLDTIEKLEQLQLIRRSVKSSNGEYEIAHDYIAHAFVAYSHSNMDRNIKDALDIYLSDFMDASHKAQFSNTEGSQAKKREEIFYQRRKSMIDQQNKVLYFKIISMIFSVLIVVTDIVYRFIWNPWKMVNINDPTSGFFPVFIPIHLLLCVCYFYQMFDKVLRFYSGRNAIWIKVIYFIIAAISYISEICYPHFLTIDGIDLVIIGLSFAMLLDNNYRESSRKALRGYGLRCMIMGGAFALAHITFCVFNQILGKEILLLEIWAMGLLVGFAHFSHITKEYLYGRRMDVSGESI